MTGKNGLSEIRTRIDILLDDIEISLRSINMDTDDIETSVKEIMELMVKSGESARDTRVYNNDRTNR